MSSALSKCSLLEKPLTDFIRAQMVCVFMKCTRVNSTPRNFHVLRLAQQADSCVIQAVASINEMQHPEDPPFSVTSAVWGQFCVPGQLQQHWRECCG